MAHANPSGNDSAQPQTRAISRWPRSPWFYWIVAFLLAVAYLFVEATGSPYSASPGSALGAWEKFVNTAYGHVGELLTLSIVALFAGFALAGITKIFDDTWFPALNKEWLPRLTAAVENGLEGIGQAIAKRVDDGKAGIILRTINNDELQLIEYNQIAKAALRKQLRDETPDCYSDFLIDELLDKLKKDGGFVRQSFQSSITIRRPEDGHPLYGKNVFVKVEDQKFLLKNAGSSSHYPLRLATKWRADRNRLKEVLDRKLMDFRYEIDGHDVLKINALLKDRSNELLDGHSLSSEGVVIQYDGEWLTVFVDRSMETKFNEAWISYHSITTLEGDDRVYVMGIRDPVFNFASFLHLSDGLHDWKIRAPLIGPSLYNRAAAGLVMVDPKEGGGRDIRVTVPKWVMPGIIASYEWAPPAAT